MEKRLWKNERPLITSIFYPFHNALQTSDIDFLPMKKNAYLFKLIAREVDNLSMTYKESFLLIRKERKREKKGKTDFEVGLLCSYVPTCHLREGASFDLRT